MLLVVVIILTTCCLLPVSPARARRAQARRADAYVRGDAAKLSNAHVRKLLTLRTPIAVPTYVPDGFRVSDVTAKRDTKTIPNYPIIDYAITYTGTRGKSFSINSANEGIGDLFLSEKMMMKGSNPYFEHPIEVGYLDDDGDGTAEKEVASQWIGSRRQYQLRKNAEGAQQVYHLRAEGITVRDALRIMESLRYLKP